MQFIMGMYWNARSPLTDKIMILDLRAGVVTLLRALLVPEEDWS